MSRSIGHCIADSLQLGLGYAERLMQEITPETFARFANVGGTAINSNHPAFVLGHLSLYPEKIVSQLGHDATAITVSQKFQEVFHQSTTCQDDPDGTIYPAMDDVTKAFFEGYQLALEKLRAADDEVFQLPNPGEGRIKELFPTVGSMHTFYVGGHLMMHLGQMSAWRRMQGLSPA